MKTLHIINTLEHGGAQSVLLQFLEGLSPEQNSQMVITLKEQNQLSDKFEALNIPVKVIHPKNFIKLIQAIRNYQPHVIQTWLYHSDLIGSLVKILNWQVPLVWGVHHTTSSLKTLKSSTAVIVKVLSFLSHLIPNQIICCSESARQTHLALGYSKKKMIVIPNGINVNRFQPNSSTSDLIKKELGIDKNTALIGMFARYHPQKDFHTMIHAAKILILKNPNVRFVLAGSQVDSSNQELMNLIKNADLQNHFHLLGIRNDMPSLLAAMKLVTLTSSHGEALPQILAEAMACGVPCVATDIGDTFKLINNTGIVVQAKRADLLAEAWEKLLNLPDAEYNLLSLKARQRIQEFYNSNSMLEQYKKVYQSVMRHEINISH